MFTSVSVFFLALSLRTVKSDDPVYGAVGDEVVLKPGPVQGPITEIMWKHGQDLAMEQYQGSVEAFRQFKERGSLNVTTGALTITGLTPRDSGSYTAEINNKVASTTQLLVISRVSKPTVSTQCDADHCVFTCESNDTTAEPVTYSWMAEEKSWISTKEINITKDESEKQFHCELSNPVSTELSELVINPLINWKWYYTMFSICPALLIGGLIALIFFILYKRNKKKGKSYYRALNICPALLILGLICFIGFNLLILYYRKKRKDEWYTAVSICSIVLIGGLIALIFLIFKKRNKRKDEWYYTVLIVGSMVLILALICLIFFILYFKKKRKDEWYYTVLTVGSILVIGGLIGIIFFIMKQMKKRKERRLQKRSGPNSDNQALGSEPPGGSNGGSGTNGLSENRHENVVSEVEVSINHVPPPTASLENSEEREPLMGSSRDPESDVTSETSRKDETSLKVSSVQVHTNQTASEDTANETEVPGASNQDPTSDAAPESSCENDIGPSPDQVLTDAANEAVNGCESYFSVGERSDCLKDQGIATHNQKTAALTESSNRTEESEVIPRVQDSPVQEQAADVQNQT